MKTAIRFVAALVLGFLVCGMTGIVAPQSAEGRPSCDNCD